MVFCGDVTKRLARSSGREAAFQEDLASGGCDLLDAPAPPLAIL